MQGVENVLEDGITRWKGNNIQSRLTKETLVAPWKSQELGVEGAGGWSEILRPVTHLGELRSQLGGLMRKVGECG